MAQKEKYIVVHVAAGDTWDDLIGDQPEKPPKYYLTAGRPVEIGDGIFIATTVGSKKEENSIDPVGHTIKLKWTVPDKDNVTYYLDAVPRHGTTEGTTQRIGFGEVYVLESGKAGTVDPARSWGGANITKDPPEGLGFPRGLGFENKVAAKPTLYEVNGNEAPQEKDIIFQQGFWIPGKGVLSPTPLNKVTLWFESKPIQGRVSGVDQSEKYTLDLDMTTNFPEQVMYDENGGWSKYVPEKSENKELKDGDEPSKI